jgi:general secretion pathway protein D
MKSRTHRQAAHKSVIFLSVFSGGRFWIAFFAILTVFGLWSPSLQAQSANSLFKRGESAEAKQDYDAAYENFQKAYTKAPKNLEYRAALYRVRITASAVHMTKGRKLLEGGNEQGALAEFLHASEIDPSNEAAEQAIAEVRKRLGETPPANDTSVPETQSQEQELESMGSPAVLKPVSNEPLSLHMTEDAKVIYQAVGKAAGINVLFDPDYISKRVQVDLNNVSLLDALRIVGTISKTYWRPVTENTVFVADSSDNKRRQSDEQAVQTFYLSNAWQQADLTDVQTALRNVMPNAKAYAVASQNAIVMRGTPDELLLAQKLINDLDKARPEVVVDIAVLEVSKNWERTLGIAWPSSYGIALQPSTGSSTTTSTANGGTASGSSTNTPTLYQLSHLKATDFAVTVGAATANLLLTDSNTKILQNPRIRATDGQKQTMTIGSKIPEATGSFQSGVGSVAGISPMAETQFTYIDVGVKIEMTPTVHFDHDVTLKIKIEISSQSGQVTIEGVTEPIISQRVVDQVIRLREGEASILGGIQDKQEQTSWSGIPGLSSIPLLKYLFGSKDHSTSDDELVFVVVPHIVRSHSLDQVNLRTVDTGEGQSIDLRHVSSEAPVTNPESNPAAGNPPAPVQRQQVRPGDDGRSSVGTVPGSSAMNAAPAALAQMHQAAEANGNMAPAFSPPVIPPTAAPQPQAVRFSFTPPAVPLAANTIFKLPVALSGGTDIASVPMQIQYDPTKLSLLNVDSGDFLSRDGQAVALVHRDDGSGMININAARPPGAAGASGSGVVCVLTFQAKAAGESAVVISRPWAVNSKQQQLPAEGARISIQVQ